MRAKAAWKRGLGRWLTDAVFVALVFVVAARFSDGNIVRSERHHILIALGLILPYAALRVMLPRLWRRRREKADRAESVVIDRRR